MTRRLHKSWETASFDRKEGTWNILTLHSYVHEDEPLVEYHPENQLWQPESGEDDAAAVERVAKALATIATQALENQAVELSYD